MEVKFGALRKILRRDDLIAVFENRLKMGYKTYEKEQDMFFKYNPVKKFKKIQNKKVSNENPFKVLKNLKLG